MYKSVISGAFRGLDSFLVQVEVDISEGLPCMEMIGYLANEVKESRDRVRVGIKNSGYSLPIKRITISLRPADMRKDGAGFDLPVALGILLAMEEKEAGKDKQKKKNESEKSENEKNENEKSEGEEGESGKEECRNDEILKNESGKGEDGIGITDEKNSEEVSGEFMTRTLVIGEMGLDGEVKPVKGILPILLKASKEGIKNCILPEGNVLEARNVKTIALYPVKNLAEAFEVAQAEGAKGKYVNVSTSTGSASGTSTSTRASVNVNSDNDEGVPAFTDMKAGEEDKRETDVKTTENEETYAGSEPDFSQICGQQQAKMAAEVSAAGFHNLLLFGPPGSGKSMIAERIPTILPEMTYEECLEVTQIYSVAGLLDAGTGLITKRPYERPHHTITPAALTGGGAHPMPGAITMAHKGVLFLDELPEFGREKLDLLRQPLEEKKIRLIRNQYACDYQCDFMFVAAMNPCPCGYYPDRRKCNCKENEVRRYLKRVSGPILDRMDISVEVGKIEWAALTDKSLSESSESIRKRVTAAHNIQIERQGKYNSALSNEELDRFAVMDDAAEKLIARIFDRKQLSIRGYQRIRKLARTIADLKNTEIIGENEVAQAVLMNQGMESLVRV